MKKILCLVFLLFLTTPALAVTLVPGADGFLIPDYFGIVPNYANSPLPVVTGHDPVTGAPIIQAGTGMRKFVDPLPGLYVSGVSPIPAPGTRYIPVAVADKTTYAGSDYYEIEVGEYTQQMHSDLPPTRLRGYRQTNAADPYVGVFSYLGPVIIAQRDRPVRVKFTNNLPFGPPNPITGRRPGDLFIPVDTSYMGWGPGRFPIPAGPVTLTKRTLRTARPFTFMAQPRRGSVMERSFSGSPPREKPPATPKASASRTSPICRTPAREQ